MNRSNPTTNWTMADSKLANMSHPAANVNYTYGYLRTTQRLAAAQSSSDVDLTMGAPARRGVQGCIAAHTKENFSFVYLLNFSYLPNELHSISINSRWSFNLYSCKIEEIPRSTKWALWQGCSKMNYLAKDNYWMAQRRELLTHIGRRELHGLEQANFTYRHRPVPTMLLGRTSMGILRTLWVL